MSHPGARFIALIGLLWPFPFWGQVQKPKLLPTGAASRQVQGIQAKLTANLDPGTFAAEKALHERQFERIKNIVTSFVIAQFEAEPEITRWQLRDRLIRILGVKFDESTPDHLHEPPYVFQVLPLKKADPAVWAICYRGDVYNGFGGARTVVESYVVEEGKARLAGRGGSQMNGYGLSAEQIWNPSAHSTSILTSGVLLWSSGHALPAAVALYGVSPAGVKALWKFSAPGLSLMSNGEMFAIEYHDENRHAKNLSSTAVDVYYVGNSEIPYRIIHQFPVFPKP